MTNSTFNLPDDTNFTMPRLGKIIDFELNYTLQPEHWENFSGFGLQVNGTGYLESKSGKAGTAEMPKNGVYINFTDIHGTVNFTDLLKDANETFITTGPSNFTAGAVNLTEHGMYMDTYFNETTSNAQVQVAATGLNPEYGLNNNSENLGDPLGNTPYLYFNCSTDYETFLSNASMKVPFNASEYNESTVKINYFNYSSGNWTELPTVIWNDSSNTTYAVANTSHCSVYGIGGSVYGRGGSVGGNGGGDTPSPSPGGGGPPAPADDDVTNIALPGIISDPTVDVQLYTSFTSIPLSKTGTMEIPTTEGMPLTELAILVKNKVTSVSITVKSLNTKPVTQSDVSGEVIRYIKIDHKNIVNADVDKMTIKFKVEKTWLEENGFTTSEIVLNRYSNTVWNSLPTTMTSDDNTYVYYSAESPGLSYFAITASKEVPIETPAPTEAPVETSTPTEAPASTQPPTTIAPTMTPTETPTHEEPIPTTPAPTPVATPAPPTGPSNLIIAGAVIVLLAVIVFILNQQGKIDIGEFLEKLKAKVRKPKEETEEEKEETQEITDDSGL